MVVATHLETKALIRGNLWPWSIRQINSLGSGCLGATFQVHPDSAIWGYYAGSAGVNFLSSYLGKSDCEQLCVWKFPTLPRQLMYLPISRMEMWHRVAQCLVRQLRKWSRDDLSKAWFWGWLHQNPKVQNQKHLIETTHNIRREICPRVSSNTTTAGNNVFGKVIEIEHKKNVLGSACNELTPKRRGEKIGADTWVHVYKEKRANDHKATCT